MIDRLRLQSPLAGPLHSTVGDPRRLWDDFKDAICDDLPHAIAHFERPRLDFPDSNHDFGRFLLARDLEENGKPLSPRPRVRLPGHAPVQYRASASGWQPSGN